VNHRLFATTFVFIQTGAMDDSTLRLIVFFSVLIVMALAEFIRPRRALIMGYKRWPANLGVIVFDVLIARIVLPAGAVGASLWALEHDIGLFNWLAWNDAVTFVLAVILLDMVVYGQHMLFHRIPLLWRLHMVHHADREIDVSTGLRFHPVEILLSMFIKMSVVVLLGAPALAVVIFEMILNAMAMFNHANFHLPLKLDAFIRKLVITPDLHRIHHSIIKNETNSNYGFNLSIWDRLFGTYRAQPQLGHDGMVIGLEHLQDAPTHRIDFMLRLPFNGEIGQYPMPKTKPAKQREGNKDVR